MVLPLPSPGANPGMALGRGGSRWVGLRRPAGLSPLQPRCCEVRCGRQPRSLSSGSSCWSIRCSIRVAVCGAVALCSSESECSRSLAACPGLARRRGGALLLSGLHQAPPLPLHQAPPTASSSTPPTASSPGAPGGPLPAAGTQPSPRRAGRAAPAAHSVRVRPPRARPPYDAHRTHRAARPVRRAGDRAGVGPARVRGGPARVRVGPARVRGGPGRVRVGPARVRVGPGPGGPPLAPPGPLHPRPPAAWP
jgi:hypothetical protein